LKSQKFIFSTVKDQFEGISGGKVDAFVKSQAAI
jgi:hypothetical protein